jgi:hypothetical protein
VLPPLPFAFEEYHSNHPSLRQTSHAPIDDYDFVVNLTLEGRLIMKKKFEKHATVISTHGFGVGSNPESLNGRHEKIARLAYSYWESRTGQGGSPEEDWFQAEREITTQESRLSAKNREELG